MKLKKIEGNKCKLMLIECRQLSKSYYEDPVFPFIVPVLRPRRLRSAHRRLQFPLLKTVEGELKHM